MRISNIGTDIVDINRFRKKEYNENKKFYDKECMNDIQIAVNSTDPVYRKRSFVYDFLSSMRQKINDPLGVRAKKRKEISQR